jgi:tetratricopeptide (TPR) repeat protein
VGNLAVIAQLRGHPEVAERRFRETVATFRELGRPMREALHLSGLANALFDLGRTEEALAAIAESVRLARLHGADQLPEHLNTQALLRIGVGDFAEVEARAAEIEQLSRSSGSPLGLALADEIRGRLALARGEVAAGITRLEECRRLFAEAGAGDGAAAVQLEIAEARLHAGELEAAGALAREIGDPLRGRGENVLSFRSEAILATIDARSGELAAARERFETLRRIGESTKSVGLLLTYRTVAAELARAEGRVGDARAELELALAVAERTGRRPRAAQLRLELGGLGTKQVGG